MDLIGSPFFLFVINSYWKLWRRKTKGNIWLFKVGFRNLMDRKDLYPLVIQLFFLSFKWDYEMLIFSESRFNYLFNFLIRHKLINCFQILQFLFFFLFFNKWCKCLFFYKLVNNIQNSVMPKLGRFLNR